MAKCLIYYGSSEGQTAKIAGRIRGRLVERGITVEVIEAPGRPVFDPREYDAVLIGDSIHAGHYHRPVLDTIAKHHEVLSRLLTGFFSVCLTAKSDDPKDQAIAEQFVGGMIQKTRWKPDRVGIFAGALQYSKYGLVKRWMMRRIAESEGGDTDTSHDYEYTDWPSVDAFADAFADDVLGEG